LTELFFGENISLNDKIGHKKKHWFSVLFYVWDKNPNPRILEKRFLKKELKPGAKRRLIGS
jgi:hypothetical protein